VTVLAVDIAMNGWGRATRGDLVYIETRLNNDTYRLAVAAALWFYAFPWASLHLPIAFSGFTG